MFFLTLLVLLIADGLYLGFLNRALYKKIITKEPINMVSALVAWGFLAWAIERAANPSDAAQWAFIIYGVFNFTNHAIMKDYPLTILVGDIVWGVVLASTVKYTTLNILPSK